MKAPTVAIYRTLIGQALHRAGTVLDNAPAVRQELPELLATAIETTWKESHTNPVPYAVREWLVAEAAWHLCVAAKALPAGLTDPELGVLLARVERRPHRTQARLLRAAGQSLTVPLTRAGVSTNHSEAEAAFAERAVTYAARREVSGRACTCSCSSGGYCGGCGHAGCGGRR
ncbi:hypothetical protein [Streptomyces sp. NPDC003077]|uniref:hypothetical protein n=1 Tax=Streptomyces sp. NPDC003077 TaxID=3154443 RepID=UPI0033A73805